MIELSDRHHRDSHPRHRRLIQSARQTVSSSIDQQMQSKLARHPSHLLSARQQYGAKVVKISLSTTHPQLRNTKHEARQRGALSPPQQRKKVAKTNVLATSNK